MFTSDNYKYNYDLATQNYDYLLDKIQKSHLCVKIGDNYVTIKKYGRLNINVDDFDSFDVELHKYLEKNSFISTKKICDEFDFKILKYFNNNEEIINFIKSFSRYKIHSMGKSSVVFLRNNSYKKEYFESMIRAIMTSKGLESIDIYDLIDLIKDDYGIEYEDDEFINDTSNFVDIFVSEDTEKVYLDKKKYYEEVYG